jgi:hypothetical protein
MKLPALGFRAGTLTPISRSGARRCWGLENESLFDSMSPLDGTSIGFQRL